jgi:hypothetical protein
VLRPGTSRGHTPARAKSIARLRTAGWRATVKDSVSCLLEVHNDYRDNYQVLEPDAKVSTWGALVRDDPRDSIFKVGATCTGFGDEIVKKLGSDFSDSASRPAGKERLTLRSKPMECPSFRV